MNKFCQIDDMRFTEPDPKHDAILMAAWEAVSTYGYRKTSMDDIAKGAGISRPGLYTHFKNKEAICRSLIARYYYNAICDVHGALHTAEPLSDKLTSAFRAQAGGLIEKLLSSPHGSELLEMGNATGADLVQDGEAELAGVYARWLTAEAASGAVVLPADAAHVAQTMMASLHGIKSMSPDYQTYQQQVTVLANLTASALSK